MLVIIFKMKNRKAQEEMVGFVLIMVIVAVIILVFLSLSLRNNKKEIIESYEVNSFIQAFLQYSTGCEDFYGPVDIKDVIFMCNNNVYCENSLNSCNVLEDTLNDIIDQSWTVSEEGLIKGYELRIISGEREILSIIEGNQTDNYKGSSQDYSKRGSLINTIFTVYY